MAIQFSPELRDRVLAGEITVTVRFWIIAGLFVALGLGIFYAEWVVGTS